MAQRYGGKHSPDPGSKPATQAGTPPPRTAFTNRGVAAGGLAANLLFVLPLPLAVRALGAPALSMVLKLVALGLLLGAAFMLREGLKAEAAYNARATASRPALPRKMLAALLSGLGVALASFDAGAVPAAAAIYGVVAAGLHLGAFGLDPLADKRAEGVDRISSARVARAVDQAEEHLRDMARAIAPLGDRPLEARVERFAASVREMCRQVERDPRDLVAARRYLGVYLMGARDAARRFAEIAAGRRDAQARADFVALLDDLEANFEARRTALMADDRSALDLEINVLRERLAREGIREL